MALPKNYRVSIYLHYYEGYPVQDIAARAWQIGYVSYGGGTEPETWYYSGVSFIKDEISYYLFSADDITGEELFSMAEELLAQ